MDYLVLFKSKIDLRISKSYYSITNMCMSNSTVLLGGCMFCNNHEQKNRRTSKIFKKLSYN